jgi:phosphohistidine phosphatase SixA
VIGAVARAVVVAWLAAAGTVALAQAAAPSSEALWKQIAAGGHVLLIRHASTVAGFGDPPGFMLGDCATQRNLSEIGREESRRLGLAFRSHRVAVGEVRSSPWCRCVDTATLAFGSATVWEPLASLYNDSRDEDARREAVLREVTGYFAAGRPGNLVLVTHNFNVRSLVGVSPSQAEVIIARPAGGRLELVGRIPLP